jgi:hypothetical protein
MNRDYIFGDWIVRVHENEDGWGHFAEVEAKDGSSGTLHCMSATGEWSDGKRMWQELTSGELARLEKVESKLEADGWEVA